MNAPIFHDLSVVAVDPEAAGSVAITLALPKTLTAAFQFEPGQYISVRARLAGQDVRRSYSLCSTPALLAKHQLIQIGVRAVASGLMSNWLQGIQPGQSLAVAPPQGRFVIQRPRALHRVGIAAGSGITPILSIMTHTLENSAVAKFTLVYGNRRIDRVMFNEALQDLKDRFPDRLTLIHILSRQSQEVPLLEGHIDGDKLRELMRVFLPVNSMDEVFICGPEAMIEATEACLLSAGVRPERVRSERFASAAPVQTVQTARTSQTAHMPPARANADCPQGAGVRLSVIADGKRHELHMSPDQHVLDAALNAGLDLPYSCRSGVCCTCRAKLIAGSISMDKNFTLEDAEVRQGFVLSCQARPTTAEVVVSFDER